MPAKQKVLFDITVLMDALLNPEDSDLPSNTLLNYVDSGWIEGYVSAGAIEVMHQELARGRGPAAARALIEERICSSLKVAPIDAQVLEAALSLSCPGFDDAITLSNARAIGVDHLITLNADDFEQALSSLRLVERGIRDTCDPDERPLVPAISHPRRVIALLKAGLSHEADRSEE